MGYDLKTGEYRPPQPEDYCTKITAVAANRGGCPQWLKFLSRVTDSNEELQAYLKRVAGYCLTGSTQEHVLFFLHGTGANGKSVFLNTLRAIWHDYATTAPMETFVETRGDRHPTELAHLRAARLVVAFETERGRRWSESKIKALTGGDRIAARFMRQDFFEFEPHFKLMIAGNHKPSLRSVDEAIRRRFHLIPFTVTIPHKERDKELFEKLKPEWGGILQWAIDGCLEWQKDGLEPPKAVVDATDEYLHEENPFARWREECCDEDYEYRATAAALWDSWVEWSQRAREYTGTQKAFGQELRKAGFENKRTMYGSAWFGVKLRGA